jgi:hypothetical protein
MSAGLENNGQLLHTKEVQERFLKILNSFRPKSDQKKA